MQGTSAGAPQKKFIEACDKYLGKNSGDIDAYHMCRLFRLYNQMKQQGCANSLTHKLLLKLQKQILALFDG